MQLHELKSPKGSRKRRKIVGRGRGSGVGNTSGRGENGQKSRPGRAVNLGSEGGQNRLIRRLPKVGFRNPNPIVNQVVKLDDLNIFDKGAIVNVESLKAQGLIKSVNKPFKVLGDGDLKKALTIQTKSISKTAAEKVVKAGGKVEIIPVSLPLNHEKAAQAALKLVQKREKINK